MPYFTKLSRFATFVRINKARISKVSAEGLWVVVGQIASLLGMLVLVRVLTNYLTPSQYGVLALGLTISGLINQVFLGGLLNGINRYYAVAAEKSDLRRYLNSSAVLILWASLVAVFFSALLIGVASVFNYFDQPILLSLCVVFALFSGYSAAFNSIQNAGRQRKIVALHSGTEAWLKVGLVLVIFGLINPTATSAVTAYIAATLVVLASHLFFIRPLYSFDLPVIHPQDQTCWNKKIWSFSWPFIVWGFFGWGQQSSARWALELYSDSYQVGLFSSLVQIGYTPVQLGIGALTTFLQPILYARAGDAADKDRRDSIDGLIQSLIVLGLVVTAILVAITFWWHELIFSVFVGPEFRSVSYLLPVVIAAGGVFGVALVAGSRLFALMSVKESMPASIGSSVIGIGASFFGVYYFSTAGAAYGMLVHALSYFLLIFYTKPRKF